MRIVPFRAAHFDRLDLQAAQRFTMPYLTSGHGRFLETAGPAYSAIADGHVVGCAGLIPVWQHRAIGWALLSDAGPARFHSIHRTVRRHLDAASTRRIEIYVRSDHEHGHRWARALGFRFECGPLCRFDPGGNDYDVYVRLRDG
ncbi:MAG: hypothetical protein GY791_08350 [Alphaproteobacteria bacterium]|nr:hypothetical protein [Alphaproteobacteria bacterium]